MIFNDIEYGFNGFLPCFKGEYTHFNMYIFH